MTAVDIYAWEVVDEADDIDREYHNLNERLTTRFDRNHYNLIHSRCVGPGIKTDRWRQYIRDMHHLLKRGGWAQLTEFLYHIQSDSGLLNDDEHPVRKWSDANKIAMERGNRNYAAARHLKQWMQEAGFRHVRQQIYNIPIGQWHMGEW